MGSFNTLGAPMKCPVCGIVSEFAIQFKYAETWQYDYRLNDELRWGKRSIGDRSYQKVAIEGLAIKCPTCGAQGIDVDIICQDNVLVSVYPVSADREESLKGYRVLVR